MAVEMVCISRVDQFSSKHQSVTLTLCCTPMIEDD